MQQEYTYNVRTNLPRGQPPMDQHTGTANLQINGVSLIRERQQHGNSDPSGTVTYEGYTGQRILNIAQFDIILSPRVHPSGIAETSDFKDMCMEPFAVLNGMKRLDASVQPLDVFAFRGIALGPFQYDVIDIQQAQLAVATGGNMPLVNRGVRPIHEGEPLTISIDDTPFVVKSLDTSINTMPFTHPGNVGVIKKPYFVPFDPETTLTPFGVTFELLDKAIDNIIAKGDKTSLSARMQKLGLEYLKLKYIVGTAHCVTAGPIMPNFWGQIELCV